MALTFEPTTLSPETVVPGTPIEAVVTVCTDTPEFGDPYCEVDRGLVSWEVMFRDKQRAVIGLTIHTRLLRESTRHVLDVPVVWGATVGSFGIDVATDELPDWADDVTMARMRHPSAASPRTPGQRRRTLTRRWLVGGLVWPAAACAAGYAYGSPEAMVAAGAWTFVALAPAMATGWFRVRPERVPLAGALFAPAAFLARFTEAFGKGLAGAVRRVALGFRLRRV